MATVGPARRPSIATSLGALLLDSVVVFGDFVIFSLRTFRWMITRLPARGTMADNCFAIGVRSVPVVALTGGFIGMVLAVQMYSSFHEMGFASRLGAIINVSIVRELGPVLAASMLAGRVGSAMSAELATMKISEQIDALACLGASPIHFLVAPRVWACVLLIPLLTIVADFMGIIGGALICIGVYQVDAHYYWEHSQSFVTIWDVATGLVKAIFFGGAIALVSCYRGLHSKAGAEGVGRSATGAFVISFLVIFVLDFFLGLFLMNLFDDLVPRSASLF